MKIFLTFLIGLALSLAVSASTVPILEGLAADPVQPFSMIPTPSTTNVPAGYDPSVEYHKYSTIQVWVGKDRVSVGDTLGVDLYIEVWTLLDHACPTNTGEAKDGKCHIDRTDVCYDTFGGSRTCLGGIRAEWKDEQTRALLIGSIAGTLEALTKRDVGGSSTCYMQDGKKLCNVGDVVRVNLPTTIIITNPQTWKRNFMHVKLWNLSIKGGNWECCEGDKLKLVDKAIDGLGPEIGLVFWEPHFSRDSRCIINGWETCPLSGI